MYDMAVNRKASTNDDVPLKSVWAAPYTLYAESSTVDAYDTQGASKQCSGDIIVHCTHATM